MNWKTREIIKEAKAEIADAGVFSEDQILLLQKLIHKLGEAIDQEAESNKPSVNYHV